MERSCWAASSESGCRPCSSTKYSVLLAVLHSRGEGSSSGAGDANMCPVPSSRLVRLMIGRERVSGRILYKAVMIIAVQGKYAAVSGCKRKRTMG